MLRGLRVPLHTGGRERSADVHGYDWEYPARQLGAEVEDVEFGKAIVLGGPFASGVGSESSAWLTIRCSCVLRRKNMAELILPSRHIRHSRHSDHRVLSPQIRFD